VTLLADHGNLQISLLFMSPVLVILVALLVLTLRDRRRAR
jgi:hypothetical protein